MGWAFDVVFGGRNTSYTWLNFRRGWDGALSRNNKTRLPVYSVANAIAFSIHVIEISYCKLTGKQRSVITVPCFRMRLL